MWHGAVDARAVMEPWIALGEKLGCKTLCEGHYLGAENASDDMDEATFTAINRAVARAVDILNADKRRYLHYLIDDPRQAKALARYGGLTPDDLHLPRLRYAKATPYTDAIVEDTYHWMVRWGLISDAACPATLVESRLSETASAPAADSCSTRVLRPAGCPRHPGGGNGARPCCQACGVRSKGVVSYDTCQARGAGAARNDQRGRGQRHGRTTTRNPTWGSRMRRPDPWRAVQRTSRRPFQNAPPRRTRAL